MPDVRARRGFRAVRKTQECALFCLQTTQGGRTGDRFRSTDYDHLLPLRCHFARFHPGVYGQTADRKESGLGLPLPCTPVCIHGAADRGLLDQYSLLFEDQRKTCHCQQFLLHVEDPAAADGVLLPENGRRYSVQAELQHRGRVEPCQYLCASCTQHGHDVLLSGDHDQNESAHDDPRYILCSAQRPVFEIHIG